MTKLHAAEPVPTEQTDQKCEHGIPRFLCLHCTPEAIDTGGEAETEVNKDLGNATTPSATKRTSVEKKTDYLHAVKTEVDPTTVAAKIAPITVGDPLDIASLAIPQEHLEELTDPDAAAASSVVECHRPAKGTFFTVRAEPLKQWADRGLFWILQMEGRDPYLVAPTIAEIKKEEEQDVLRPLLLVRYVTMGGEEGLWPLKLNQGDGKANAWNTSALNILKIAEDAWVRIVSMKKSFRHQVSKKNFQEVPPKFSDRPFLELVTSAFQGEQYVRSLDHQVWEDLKHGSKK